MEPSHKRTPVLIPAPKPAVSRSDSEYEVDVQLKPVMLQPPSPKRVNSLSRLPRSTKLKVAIELKKKVLEPDCKTSRLLMKRALQALNPTSVDLTGGKAANNSVSRLPQLMKAVKRQSASPIANIAKPEAYYKRQSLPKLSFRKWTFLPDTRSKGSLSSALTPVRMPRQPSYQYRSKLQRDPLLRKSPLGFYQYVDAESFL